MIFLPIPPLFASPADLENFDLRGLNFDLVGRFFDLVGRNFDSVGLSDSGKRVQHGVSKGQNASNTIIP